MSSMQSLHIRTKIFDNRFGSKSKRFHDRRICQSFFKIGVTTRSKPMVTVSKSGKIFRQVFVVGFCRYEPRHDCELLLLLPSLLLLLALFFVDADTLLVLLKF